MGLESPCVAVLNGKRTDGTLLLEGDELILRGEARRKFKISSLKKLNAKKNVLSATTADGEVSFELEGDAEKWLKKIQNPPTRESKLGIKPDTEVFLQGDFEPAFVKAIQSNRTDDAKAADLILIAAETKSDLIASKALAKKLAKGAALWVIYPKGVKTITQADVFKIVRGIGLVDVKVMSFSPTHTGLKFVHPKSK